MSISIFTATVRADPALIKNFRVVIYNGDWDSCVPYTDAEAWTEGMGYDVKDPWHAWMYNLTFEGETTSQVGGYATRCEMARFLSPICASATERFFSAFLLQTMCRPISRSSPCAVGKSRLAL